MSSMAAYSSFSWNFLATPSRCLVTCQFHQISHCNLPEYCTKVEEIQLWDLDHQAKKIPAHPSSHSSRKHPETRLIVWGKIRALPNFQPWHGASNVDWLLIKLTGSQLPRGGSTTTPTQKKKQLSGRAVAQAPVAGELLYRPTALNDFWLLTRAPLRRRRGHFWLALFRASLQQTKRSVSRFDHFFSPTALTSSLRASL